MEDHDLGLTPEEKEAFARVTAIHVSLQPGKLRICNKTCPMHDTCPYIVSIDPTKRPYDKRCPYEAEMLRTAFEQNLMFVKSMDPDCDPNDVMYIIPDVEQGLCWDLAFHTVVEHRLSLTLAKIPDATVNAPVPGAGGAMKLEENPAYSAWTKAVEKRMRYQENLRKTVEARLKRAGSRAEARELTIEAVRRAFQENREELKDSSYKKVFDLADEATKENIQDQKKKLNNEAEGDRGGGPK